MSNVDWQCNYLQKLMVTSESGKHRIYLIHRPHLSRVNIVLWLHVIATCIKVLRLYWKANSTQQVLSVYSLQLHSGSTYRTKKLPCFQQPCNDHFGELKSLFVQERGQTVH